uniref:Uncharacterized protein n=1 Tax=Romanomermis culicivorax TaxID=13658 RepID=A0A915K629_ROMCU
MKRTQKPLNLPLLTNEPLLQTAIDVVSRLTSRAAFDSSKVWKPTEPIWLFWTASSGMTICRWNYDLALIIEIKNKDFKCFNYI